MAGITDRAFRSFMREMGAGVVVTELVSATGLKYSNQKTRDLMRFDEIQHPVGVQIFGEEYEDLSYAAKEIEQMGADFVDINFGCPVQKVVKKGAGAAALKDLAHMRNVVRAVKSAVKIPVTIKVRTGWDANTRNTHEVTQLAYDEGVEWVAIHGRTRAQAYTGQADWEYIREVKMQSKVPVLGNGDINGASKANQRLQESGCDGVLIGRGCLKNPWIFRESQRLRLEGSAGETEKDFGFLFSRLHEHLAIDGDSRRVALQIKKLAAWYSAGYPGSANFRRSIFQLSTTTDVLDAVTRYFDELRSYIQKDTSDEPFLMGGHG
jgi:nifR3 family TIM-barrel protein